MPFKLMLPKRDGSKGMEELDIQNNSVVITGANGSGKTRLGVWLESRSVESEKFHRISAHRILNIPRDGVNVLPYEQARKRLLYGSPEGSIASRTNGRWGNIPETMSLNDFDQVLGLLMAERFKSDRNYREISKQSIGKPITQPEPTPDEIIEDIWNKVFPHCKIKFDLDTGKINVINNKDALNYPGNTLSDGERSALYLMAQVLCVPLGTILIIDEPELHLHRSIFFRLWNQLGQKRPDCLFVYFTHDLEFAASQVSAKKLWIKEHTHPDKWIWEDIPDHSLPEELLLKVLGSRHHVIFVEGEYNSLDFSLYQTLFQDLQIIPCGNSAKVIENTKAFRDMTQLHHRNVYGLIDRDRRPQGELDVLSKRGIFALEVAEIENLYCIPETIEVMVDWCNRSNLSAKKNIEEVKKHVKHRLFELITLNLDEQVLIHTQQLVEYRLSKALEGNKTYQELAERFKNLNSAIDIEAIRKEIENEFLKAAQNQDYDLALKLYNQKGFLTDVARHCGISREEYINNVIRLLSISEGDKIREALHRYIPKGLFESDLTPPDTD